MHDCTICGERMITREAAHAELARVLDFPSYYGANLDALWDEVSTLSVALTLTDPAPMLNALGSYGCKLLQTLFDANKENPDFSFHIK